MNDWAGYSGWIALGTMAGGALAWHFWEGSVRPRLIPAGEIERLAANLVAKHGDDAEEMAFIEEDRAWRYSNGFEQGKWRRVRLELWRRG